MEWMLKHKNCTKEDYKIKNHEFTIGRATNCSFTICSKYISNTHAVMLLKDDSWIVRDLKSSNGVFVGSHRVKRKEDYIVKEGDLIGFAMPCTSTRSDLDAIYELVRIRQDSEESTEETIDILPKKVIDNETKQFKRRYAGTSKTLVMEPEVIDLAESDIEEDNNKCDLKNLSESSNVKVANHHACTSLNSELETSSNAANVKVIKLKSNAEDEVNDINCRKDSTNLNNEHVDVTDKKCIDETKDDLVNHVNYSQEDVIIVLDDDDDYENLLTVNQIKQEVKQEPDGYKERLWESLDFSEDCRKLSDETARLEPTDWENLDVSSPETSSDHDGTKRNLNVAAFHLVNTVKQWNIEMLQNEAGSVHSNDVGISKDSEQLEAISSVIINNASNCDESCSSTEPTDTSHFFPVLSQTFSDSESEFTDTEVSTAVDNNTTIENVAEYVPEHVNKGKIRIAHAQADRLKPPSNNLGRRLLNLIEPRTAPSRKRRLSNCFPSASKKPKLNHLRRRVLKVHDNRIRGPGGGSDSRMSDNHQSLRRSMPNRNQMSSMPHNISDRSQTLAAGSVNISKPSTREIPVPRVHHPKVCQRAGSSRVDLLIKSFSTDSKAISNKRVNSTRPCPTRKRLVNNVDNLKAQNPSISNRDVNNSTEQESVRTSLHANNEQLEYQKNQRPELREQKDLRSILSKNSPSNDDKDSSQHIGRSVTQSHGRTNSSNFNSGDRVQQKENLTKDAPIENFVGDNRSSHHHSNGRRVTFNAEVQTRMIEPIHTPSTSKFISKENGIVTRKGKYSYKSQFVWDILQWNTMWLNQQIASDYPPPIITKKLIPVANFYTNQESYEKTYGPLIKSETWENIMDDYKQNSKPHSISVIVKSVGNEIDKNQNSTKLYAYGVTSSKESKSLMTGWLGILCLLLQPNDKVKNSATSVFGFIEYLEYCDINKLNNNPNLPIALNRALKQPDVVVVDIVIRIKFNNGIVINTEKSMKFQLLSYLLPDTRLYAITHDLQSTKWSEIIFNPGAACKDLPKLNASSSLADIGNFNECQMQTILKVKAMCLNSPEVKNVALIHGPPGTGKTKVIVAVIKELLIAYQDLKPHDLKILVLAPSNGAVNELTSRLIVLKKDLEYLHLVRVGQSNNIVDGRVREFTMDEYLKRRRAKQQQDKSPWPGDLNVRHLQLKRSNVITTTLGSCIRREMEILRQFRNIICIIDEASQCVEPESLLPLEYNISKLIIVGDHKQLPATVKSRVAVNHGYRLSLFERLHRNFEGIDDGRIMLLTEQHRMHPDLCIFPSKTFYDNKLETSKTVKVKEDYSLPTYTVFNLTDSQEMKAGKDYYNQLEAEFVLHLCEMILRRHRMKIGIITFYSGQKTAFAERKKEVLKGKDAFVEINTVDGFQGREKDCIILSAVRTNSRDSVFIGNPNRMNVALTRARHALYIVGHFTTLRSNDEWQKLFIDAENRGVCCVASSACWKQTIDDFGSNTR